MLLQTTPVGATLEAQCKRGNDMPRKYDPKAGEEVRKMMHEHKHHGKFVSNKQAIAVGLSKARQKGERVPEKED